MRVTLLLLIIIIYSCRTSLKDDSIKSSELEGIWSGILFQTESPFDSLIICPANAPKEAIFFKNEESYNYPIERKNNTLIAKGKGGLRLDVTIKDRKFLYGIITQNLWSQSLKFSKQSNKWSSKINKPEIIDTDYYVFLEFYRDQKGILQANIQSNKENRKLHFTIDSISISDNKIDFAITNERFGLSAAFDRIGNKLHLKYKNSGGEKIIPLAKLQPRNIEGYKPLKSSEEAYSYKIPEPESKDLEVGSLEEVGISSNMLVPFKNFNSRNYDHIHSILIIKDNKLVFEEYFHGYTRDKIHDIRSVNKSIASLLLGKAIAFDQRININNSILQYYPKYKIQNKDFNSIEVGHVLTMSTGIKLENEDEMQWDNHDWVGYKLNLPLEAVPGEKYEYSSGGANLLTGVIQSATDQYLPLFLYENLLLPLGIEKFQMRTSPLGRAYLAGDFYLRPVDLAKFGLLILNKGKWQNQQIIDADWIEKSTQSQIKGSYPKNSDYGYLWRILKRKVGGKEMKTIEAWGNGGQFLIIIPDVNMVITFTGGNYNLFPDMEDKPFSILNEYILPSVKIEKN